MKQILIIDDNNTVQAFLKELLTIEGYQVITASNGDDGIALQKESPVDLVITDMCMPQKSGIDTIQELKQDFPDLKFIAMSGGPGSESTIGFTIFEQMLEAALKVGASTTLTKPIDTPKLLHQIKILLEQE